MNCNLCNDKCRQTSCSCPVQILGIEAVSYDGCPSNILRFNVGGKRVDYDFGPLVKQAETSTSLVTNLIKRLLIYTGETHVDTITAQELGAILHLADIGDVSSAGARDGSMLTYQKSSNCGEGCVGTGDKWQIWNALDHQVASATYPFVFTQDGKPRVLSRPEHPEQYYQLGWNAGDQVSYSQIPIVTTPPVGTDGKAVRLYLDPVSNQIVGVKEDE